MKKLKWSEISVHTTNEAVEPISNIMHEFGAAGVVIEDPLDLMVERHSLYGEIFELNPDDYPREGVIIKAYFPQRESLSSTIRKLKDAVEGLVQYDINLGKNDWLENEVNEEDWATSWKKYFKPVKITDRLTIKPTWETYDPDSEQELIIELDPGMAFGTGTHPTTMLSLQALEAYVKEGDVVIDVGCGSGVLSIASVLLGAEKVFAYDLDQLAVDSTRKNALANHLDQQIVVQLNNLLDQVDKKADIIVSNILAEIIVHVISDAWNNLKQGGYFITSGIIQAKKQVVLDEMKQHGFIIIECNEMEDWVSIVARKGESSIKNLKE